MYHLHCFVSGPPTFGLGVGFYKLSLKYFWFQTVTPAVLMPATRENNSASKFDLRPSRM
jgi:hypothetical protein